MSHRRALALGLAVAFLPLAACATSDDAPPTLRVDTPSRGTLAESSHVTVIGQVDDDAPGRVRVAVNGVEAPVALDGSFTATVPVAPGIAILETVAIDPGGNRVRDVRAVLAGTLAPATAPVRDAVALHVGPDGFAAIGAGIGRAIEALDLTALVTPMNPVFHDPGCLGATVDVTRVQIGDVDVRLVPAAGQLAADVSVTSVRVDLFARYKVACVSGSSNVVVRAARVRVGGGVGLDVVGGDLRSAARDVTVALEGFDLQAGGLPGVVLDLIEGTVRDRITAALRDVIAQQLPPRVDAALAEVAGRTYAVPALGRSIAVSVTPTDVDLEASGALIVVDGALRVAGGEGGAYLSTPARAAALGLGGGGAALAIADDTINQLFGGLWAAGALDLAVPIERGHPLQLLLGAETAGLSLEMSLPPTVSATAGGDLRLAVGDLIVRGLDDAGEEVSRTAVSLATSLGAEAAADGRIRLRLGAPEVFAQVLWQRDDLSRTMDGAQVEELVRSVWGIVGSTAEGALEAVPLPSVAGVELRAPSLASAGGYAIVRADLVAP